MFGKPGCPVMPFRVIAQLIQTGNLPVGSHVHGRKQVQGDQQVIAVLCRTVFPKVRICHDRSPCLICRSAGPGQKSIQNSDAAGCAGVRCRRHKAHAVCGGTPEQTPVRRLCLRRLKIVSPTATRRRPDQLKSCKAGSAPHTVNVPLSAVWFLCVRMCVCHQIRYAFFASCPADPVVSGICAACMYYSMSGGC